MSVCVTMVCRLSGRNMHAPDAKRAKTKLSASVGRKSLLLKKGARNMRWEIAKQGSGVRQKKLDFGGK